jgi:tRNA pseudouridine38-40 synthase
MEPSFYRPAPGWMRVKLRLAYCGTPWLGWQGQGNGRTVQEQLELALGRLLGRKVELHGASRTDAGVHALGQVAHVDVPAGQGLPLEKWGRGINGLLPETIRVLAVEAAPVDFHASLSALEKTYLYRLRQGPAGDPFLADRVWWVTGPLDVRRMREAAGRLCGTRNWVRMSANRGDQTEAQRRADVVGHTRTLREIRMEEVDGEWQIRVTANAFLYHMARTLVGSLVHVGRGRADVSWLEGLLESAEGPQAQQLAPAGGLYLERVVYG